jgi:hypothetical protein
MENENTNEETHDETNTAEEGQAEESSEGQGSSEGNDDTVTLTKAELDAKLKEARKDQDKRWKERIKGAHGSEDDADDEEEGGTATKGDERYDRLELKTEGITDKKEQDAVIEYARFKKISVTEALNSPAVKAELRELRDKASTPSPSRRTSAGGGADTVEYWVDQYNKGGKSAPSLKMRRKVRQALKNRT